MNYKQRLLILLLSISCIASSDRLLSKAADPEQGVLGGQKSDNPWNDLSRAQQRRVKQGEQVLVNENIPNDPWPCFHVYRITTATPIQVAAVFWDVAYDANYIPDCLKSIVNGHPALNMVDATYEIRVPFLPNEVSKVRSLVKTVPGGGYKIEWNVLSSKYSKSGRGSVLALPYENGSLISYSNLVVPGSSIAVILRGQAESQVQKTVAAMATQAETEVKKSPEQLTAQIQQLEKALGVSSQ
ncbi:MAG: hypothetical protein ACH346_05715 [Chthoniobacterales bacterium]